MRRAPLLAVLSVASWLALLPLVWLSTRPEDGRAPLAATIDLCESVGSLARRIATVRELGFSREQQLEAVGQEAPETTIALIERAYEMRRPDAEWFALAAETSCLKSTNPEE